MENKLKWNNFFYIEQGNNKGGTMQYTNNSPYHISEPKNNIKIKNFLIRQLLER